MAETLSKQEELEVMVVSKEAQLVVMAEALHKELISKEDLVLMAEALNKEGLSGATVVEVPNKEQEVTVVFPRGSPVPAEVAMARPSKEDLVEAAMAVAQPAAVVQFMERNRLQQAGPSDVDFYSYFYPGF